MQTKERTKAARHSLDKDIRSLRSLAGARGHHPLATPAQNLREAATCLRHINNDTVVACAKASSATTVHDRGHPRTIRSHPCVLSGQQFADDVARPSNPVTLRQGMPRWRRPGAGGLVNLGTITPRCPRRRDRRRQESLAIAEGIVVGRQLGASEMRRLTTRGLANRRLPRGGRPRNSRGSSRHRRPHPSCSSLHRATLHSASRSAAENAEPRQSSRRRITAPS